jgi:hypothetical protein
MRAFLNNFIREQDLPYRGRRREPITFHLSGLPAVGDKGISRFLLIFNERLEMKDDPQPRDKLQLFNQLDLRGFCFDPFPWLAICQSSGVIVAE